MPDQSLIGPARDRASRGDVAIHDHVCGMYEVREEQYEHACAFLAVGLARKEKCLYICEHQTPTEFMSFLTGQGVDVKEATATGSLQVVSGADVRSQIGGFSLPSMFSFLSAAEERALGTGYTAFRWGADMTWLRQDNIDPIDVFLYEAELNRFLPQFELTALCQYAMDDFNPDLLIAAAETHPLLAYNKLVCDNFYFVPPEEYLKPGSSSLKLKRILGNIITRERLMQQFLSSPDDGTPRSA